MIALLSAGILLVLFARFNSISGVILPYLQRAADPALYAHDFFINTAVIKNSSIFFNLLDFLELDITGPGFIISAYVLVSVAAGAAVNLILKNTFSINDFPLRVALLFALIFADAKLIGLNKSSWIIEHNFSLSFLACALRIWFLYFALNQRFLAMAAILIPINILAIKVGWPLIGIAVLLLFQARHRSPLTWVVLVLSLVVPLVSALLTQVALAPEERAAIFDIIKHCHPHEDNPFAGPLLQIPFFIAATGFAWIFAARFGPALAARMRMILLGSLLVFACGGLYLNVVSAILPIPLAVLLSPARALETAGFLVYLLVLLWIARTSIFSGMERVAAILAAIMFKVTPDYKWVMIAVGLGLVALALSLSRRTIERRGGVSLFSIPRLDVALGLALLAPLIGIFFAFNVSGQRTHYRYDPALGFYDAATPADAMPMLRLIAAQQADRRIIFAWERNGLSKAPWSMAVRKSGISGDPYYLPRLNDIRSQSAANAVEEKLFAGLRRGHVDAEVARALAADRVTVVLPASLAGAVSGWRVAHDFGTWREMAPAPLASDRRSSPPVESGF